MGSCSLHRLCGRGWELPSSQMAAAGDDGQGNAQPALGGSCRIRMCESRQRKLAKAIALADTAILKFSPFCLA